MSDYVRKAEFARMLGVARSYITALAAAGRIVLTADGLVDVAASRARLAETADHNRDDVAARWAEARGRETGISPGGVSGSGEGSADPAAESSSRTFADARARKEHAQADIAEMERDKQRGLLVERIAVEQAFEDVLTTLRQSLEQMPHRVAPMLVGQDLDATRATLKQEINGALTELVKNFGASVRQIAGEEGGA